MSGIQAGLAGELCALESEAVDAVEFVAVLFAHALEGGVALGVGGHALVDRAGGCDNRSAVAQQPQQHAAHDGPRSGSVGRLPGARPRRSRRAS